MKWLRLCLYLLNPLKSFWTFVLVVALIAFMFPVFFRPVASPIFYTAVLSFLAWLINKHLERRKIRYNALCALEIEFIFAISSLLKNMEKIRLALPKGIPLLLDPVPLSFKPEVLEHISRTDLKNHALNILVQLRTLDQRLNFTARAHERETEKIMTNPQLNQLAVKGMESIVRDCELVLEDAKLVQAEIKYFINNDKPIFTSYQPFYDQKDLSKSLPEILSRQETQLDEDKLKELRESAGKISTGKKDD